jgi:membrane protein DedA with SNARE-associated domain
MTPSRARTVVALLGALVPGVAAACPVCFAGGNPRVLETYYLTAVAMTVLPLLIVGVFALWLHRRFRDAAAAASETPPAAPQSSSA